MAVMTKKTFNELPIGVFDSGIGGLTVLRALEQVLPQETFLYLGDMARLPYGTKSHDNIIRYTQQAAHFLIQQGIKLLVIACNTATTAALPVLQQAFPEIPILGVLEPGAKAASLASRNGHIAVIATEATVNSGGYQNTIKKYRPEAEVQAKACGVLVALAEEGWSDNPITESVARYYLEPLLGKQQTFSPDCLVLACTHFPVLLHAIKKVIAPDMMVVDSAAATAAAVKATLAERQLMNQQPRATPIQFLVTDAPTRFEHTAKNFLQRDIDASMIKLIDLL